MADDFHTALDRLHAAMAAVVNGDVEPVKALHSRADDVTGFYGWGGYEKGGEAVSARWDWAAKQFGGGTVAYETLSAHASGDLGFATEIETFNVIRPGASGPSEWRNRVTHVFRREQGDWRLVHRHASRLEVGPKS